MSLPLPPAELDVEARIEMTARGRDADAIPKVMGAGEVFLDENGERLQRLHNGLKVIADGYCGAWMTRLIERCRGHHEPQEERAFHHIVEALPADATMIEVGGWWSYYTMWFLKDRPHRTGLIIEPDPAAFDLAHRHLDLNGLRAQVRRGFVGERYGALVADWPDPPPRLDLAAVIAEVGFVDLLHCDAQGAEIEILEACAEAFRAGRVGWLFLSTHGAAITGDPLTHQRCLAALADLGAVVAAEHDIHESFSGDGLIVARFPGARADVLLPELSRNRYATSFYRNPLYDLATPPENQDAGVWFTLPRDSALGTAGERLLVPADKELLPHLRRHGEWHREPLDLALLHLDAQADYALVDIGANIGLFSRQFLGAFPGIRRVYAVEPDPQNGEALAFNLRKFAHAQLQLFPHALGVADGRATFYRDADNAGNYSLHADAMRGRRFEGSDVEVRDAASWALAHLSNEPRLILKIDAQGADEAIAARIPLDIWFRVVFACLEIWRIDKPAFDVVAFRALVESFPHRRFRDVDDVSVDDILAYAQGRDWMFHDLYLWR